MTYIENARQILREELAARGSQSTADDPLFVNAYALLALTTGEATTLQHVHEAWGLARSITRPDHPDLVPFEQLTPETQAYDEKFADAIHATARRLGVQAPAGADLGGLLVLLSGVGGEQIQWLFARALFEAWRDRRITSGETEHLVHGQDALVDWPSLSDAARADDFAIAGQVPVRFTALLAEFLETHAPIAA